MLIICATRKEVIYLQSPAYKLYFFIIPQAFNLWKQWTYILLISGGCDFWKKTNLFSPSARKAKSHAIIYSKTKSTFNTNPEKKIMSLLTMTLSMISYLSALKIKNFFASETREKLLSTNKTLHLTTTAKSELLKNSKLFFLEPLLEILKSLFGRLISHSKFKKYMM